MEFSSFFRLPLFLQSFHLQEVDLHFFSFYSRYFTFKPRCPRLRHAFTRAMSVIKQKKRKKIKENILELKTSQTGRHEYLTLQVFLGICQKANKRKYSRARQEKWRDSSVFYPTRLENKRSEH